ncbi:MAG TPA: anthranilate phosphoribosyltransferase [Bryobacteraceae bacterium]|jgi:anthranilate phosphoribosyltransferase|nr:anthranilate phosphoribosyltransferase [Bryobacteraceae bacterium]
MTLELLHTVAEGHSLTEQQAETAMRSLLAGETTPVMMAAFLTALRMKGETVHELTGFARAMRAAAVPLDIGPEFRPLLDTCGTGGNPASTFNISTVAAFVVAGAGVRVAKHGNRSLASRCGSADVLEALGVRTHVDPLVVKRSIEEVGIGFMFAPAFHVATRHVQPVRLELKIRSAFNFLGPLTNPAGAEMQVAGTWSDDAAAKIAGALARLGLKRGYVVHGSDGLGEVTITGPSTVFHIHDGAVDRQTISPEDFRFQIRSLEGIGGGDIDRNKAIAESVLAGEKGPAREIVLLNAALALHTAKPEWGLIDAVEWAAESIDSGAAARRLQKLRDVTA